MRLPFPLCPQFLRDRVPLLRKLVVLRRSWEGFAFENVRLAGHGVDEEENGLHVFPSKLGSEEVAIDLFAYVGAGADGCGADCCGGLGGDAVEDVG